MNVESLITDLAFILLLGEVVTVVFKWIRQPVVLGYIVAGFLASPHFKYLPSVTTESNIEFWAQIGIVVLLFSLGLEFSFKKLMRSGGSAAVTALIIVTGMMAAGYAVGRMLDFNFINSIFLGGMLSMSSTTIILKAFTDMGLRQKKFASLVLAVLVVEDLFAVLMMVVLSSIAVNNSVEGSALLLSVGKLVFFLVMWFLVGVYVLPSLLGGIRRFLNGETLLVVSMGLCLGMAVFSVYCGFSMALGAFVMGSILAGTSYAERIEHVVMPVKDLFGAVFFISVGMMVQPAVLSQYFWPILLLSAVVVAGMIVFGTFGMLVTGQSLKVAMQSGFSLTQIGEFAFIIATLGLSLHVLEPSLYPIVVAVSVITTFTTPYFIKMSMPAYAMVERHLPRRLHFLIDRYRKEADKSQASHPWRSILRRYAWRTVLYSIVLLAIVLLSKSYLAPYVRNLLPDGLGRFAVVAATLLGMSPFLVALMLPVGTAKGLSRRQTVVPRIVLTLFRMGIAIAFVVHTISMGYSTGTGLMVVAAVILLVLMLFSRRMRRSLHRIENKFMDNLNERELRRSGRKNAVVHDLHQAYMTIGDACPFAGERLMDSDLRQRFGVNLVSIQRGTHFIPIPNGRTRLYPGDIVGIIGTEEQIENLLPVMEKCRPTGGAEATAADSLLTSILLGENSPLVGHTPRSSSLRDRYNALVVAVDRGEEHIEARPDLVFAAGDLVWLVGNPSELSRLT